MVQRKREIAKQKTKDAVGDLKKLLWQGEIKLQDSRCVDKIAFHHQRANNTPQWMIFTSSRFVHGMKIRKAWKAFMNTQMIEDTG